MNGMLPENLRRPNSEPKELISSEEAEDIRNLLEAIVRQNAEIQKRLDAKPKSTAAGFAAFWDAAFSLWGVLIAAIIAGMLIRIFGN